MVPLRGQKGDTSSKGETTFLKKKCASYIKELSDMEKFTCAEVLRELIEEELSVRLELLCELKHNFETVQSKLEEHEFEALEINARPKFISSYIRVKTALTKELNSRHVSDIRHSSTIRHLAADDPSTSIIISQPKARLPLLQIPQFGGTYTEWPDFYSMFQTMVGNDSELSKIEKFQHLRTSLKDQAVDAIRSLEINDHNYDKALGILQDRFDNKRLNFQAHIKELFGLKQCEKGAVDQLRELSDKFNATLRALQTIATKEQIADGLLIHLIVNKFDVDSQMKWEETTPIKELPMLDSVMAFWNRRCQMLENVEHATVTQTPSKQVGKKSNFNSRKAFIASTVVSNCLFCNSSEHYIYRCNRFLNLPPGLRLKEAKGLQLCLNCLKKGHFLKSCKSSSCRDCGAKHHTLLHIAPKLAPVVEKLPDEASTSIAAPIHQSFVSSIAEVPKSLPHNAVFLATAVILVKNNVGSLVPCRALLDSASQLNFVSSRCANILQLRKTKSTTLVSGIGQTDLVANHTIDISMQSTIGNYATSFTAVVTQSITENQPNYTLNNIDWQIPSNIQLADPYFYKSQRIDILIGAGLFFDLLCVGQIRLSDQLPLLQKTRLGWVVSGGALPATRTSSCLAAVKAYSLEDFADVSLDEAVQKFWEIENISSSISKVSQEELDCERHFQEHYTRLDSGQYAVRLPFKRNPDQLGASYRNALNRFRNIERKLERTPEIKIQYSSFMSEYSVLGHMSTVDRLPPGVATFFLPHHCVLKADSTTTKLRVVFDGSARASSGLSLNDILMTGPTIQPKLFETLLRFRSRKIALTGDIEKMYRCIRMSGPDSFLQCILWRDNPNDDIQIFKLDTVTYGTKPASFLAIRVMQQLAADERESFPIGSKIVLRDFYVDDLISGGDSVEEVLEIKRQSTELLSRGNFKIRKWCSNSPFVLSEISEADREKCLKFNDGTNITKTLGLCWNPDSDEFLFSFSPQTFNSKVSKRSVLSMVARFYDPLGLIGPVIAKAKIFLQLLWKEKLHWDESLPQSLLTIWNELCRGYEFIGKCSFPRVVLQSRDKITVHAFCDASLCAYGACIYIGCYGSSRTALLCSKSRVSPLKTLTIPKLELSAAALLAELVASVARLGIFEAEFHCWSDSTIVLSWLKESPSNFNIFVANRVSSIQSLTSGMKWHYVPTEMNPADILSRGATPQELVNSALWKYGPDFLREPIDSWPRLPPTVIDVPEKRKRVFTSSFAAIDYSTASKFANTFDKMQRVYAYIYKFIHRSASFATTIGGLSSIDIKLGTQLLFRMIQRVHLATDYKVLQDNKPIDSSSKIYNLNPFLDSAGVIRVGGRLENSTLDFESKHPIILPKKHPITDAVIAQYHRQLLHAGSQALLASIRLQYWPIGGKRTVNRIVNKCIICFRAKPKLHEHIMGNLPLDRLQANRAFLVTGVDFCGPFFYKSEVRNKPPIKCYVSLFVCFSTKAVHMDLVADLSTSAFLAALKRFISLRGKPKTIWSDNATNFVGAKNELAELRRLFNNSSHTEAIVRQCLNDGIDWQFIPPRSPHFGGLWEASVKSAKYHFKRTVGLSVLTFDELRTLIYQISAVLNSRPLCPISENPDDIEVLTPAHFLTGAPLTSFIEPDLRVINLDRLDRWQRVSRMQQIFWEKWSKEYLTTLQQRAKWCASKPNLSIGAIVLIKDENVPPLKWKLARVIDLIKGNDGVARVAVLKTSGGTSRRAVQRLCPFPLEDDYIETHRLSTGAGC